jgi:hypothetical protein
MANRTVYVDGTTSGTPGTNGAHYATLAAALSGESGAAGDLVTGTAILNIAISTTTSATTTIDIDGFTTSSNYYINIYTTGDARHAGVWNNSAYMVAPSDAAAIYLREDYINLDGLQFTITDRTTARHFLTNITRSSGTVNISNCIFKGDGVATWGLRLGDMSSGAMATYNFWNCVFYNFGAHDSSYINCLSGSVWNFWNCTGIWGGTAVTAGFREDGGTLTCKNVYSGGCYGGRAFFGTLDQSYCASSDNSASGTGAVTSVTIDNTTFKNVAGNDYHLAGTGSPLYGAGGNNTGDTAPLNFTTDIDGDTITGRFDIGADWYYVAAAFARPSSDVAGGTFRSIHTTAPFGPIVIA